MQYSKHFLALSPDEVQESQCSHPVDGVALVGVSSQKLIDHYSS